MLLVTTLVEKKIRAYLKANCNTTLPRFDVLAALDRAQEKITMSQLSERLLVSNGNVTGVISRLVSDGLVERQVEPRDRRIQFVSLTAAGRAAFEQAAHQHELLLDSIFSDVDDDEMEQLLKLVGKLSHSVQAQLSEPATWPPSPPAAAIPSWQPSGNASSPPAKPRRAHSPPRPSSGAKPRGKTLDPQDSR
jgi:DNA-binding MarR family transcriptional regulator